jgi:hypothetical protein
MAAAFYLLWQGGMRLEDLDLPNRRLDRDLILRAGIGSSDVAFSAA